MRKLDCVEIKTCKCSCQNCLQYRSSKPKVRLDLVGRYASSYRQHEKTAYTQEEIKQDAKKNLTEKEYRVFLFEIENRGV